MMRAAMSSLTAPADRFALPALRRMPRPTPLPTLRQQRREFEPVLRRWVARLAQRLLAWALPEPAPAAPQLRQGAVASLPRPYRRIASAQR